MLTGATARARALSRDKTNLALAGVLAFACLYALASLWLPFGWDHGMFASVGEAMARGGAPYRDAWEMKGPLSYAPFALSTLLFGHVMWGIRILELVILVPILYYLHLILSRLTNQATGAATSLGLYLWFASAGFFFSAQPEIWATALTAVAGTLLLAESSESAPRARTFFVIGALIGSAGLIKVHFLALGLPPLVFLAIAGDLPIAERVRLAAMLAAGALVPFAIALLYLAVSGGLGAFIEAHIIWTATSYGAPGSAYNRTPKEIVLGTFDFLFRTPVAILAPFAALGLWQYRGQRAALVPLLTWLLVAFVVVLIQAKLFVYHWYVVYPPLMICAALGAHALLQKARDASASLLVGTAAFIFLAQVSLSPLQDVLRWAKEITGLLTDNYYDAYTRETYTATDEVNAAQYIMSRTTPDDSVFMWGNDAAIRFLANRPNPSRFNSIWPLMAKGPLLDQYRAELMQALRDKPPVYFIVGTRGPETIGKFPELAGFLAEQYALETSVGYVKLYRHTKQATSDASR